MMKSKKMISYRGREELERQPLEKSMYSETTSARNDTRAESGIVSIDVREDNMLSQEFDYRRASETEDDVRRESHQDEKLALPTNYEYAIVCVAMDMTDKPLGVVVEKRENGSFYVSQISVDSVFAGKDLREGDELVSVNKIICRGLTRSQVAKFVKTAMQDGNVIFRIRREVTSRKQSSRKMKKAKKVAKRTRSITLSRVENSDTMKNLSSSIKDAEKDLEKSPVSRESSQKKENEKDPKVVTSTAKEAKATGDASGGSPSKGKGASPKEENKKLLKTISMTRSRSSSPRKGSLTTDKNAIKKRSRSVTKRDSIQNAPEANKSTSYSSQSPVRDEKVALGAGMAVPIEITEEQDCPEESSGSTPADVEKEKDVKDPIPTQSTVTEEEVPGSLPAKEKTLSTAAATSTRKVETEGNNDKDVTNKEGENGNLKDSANEKDKVDTEEESDERKDAVKENDKVPTEKQNEPSSSQLTKRTPTSTKIKGKSAAEKSDVKNSPTPREKSKSSKGLAKPSRSRSLTRKRSAKVSDLPKDEKADAIIYLPKRSRSVMSDRAPRNEGIEVEVRDIGDQFNPIIASSMSAGLSVISMKNVTGASKEKEKGHKKETPTNKNKAKSATKPQKKPATRKGRTTRQKSKSVAHATNHQGFFEQDPVNKDASKTMPSKNALVERKAGGFDTSSTLAKDEQDDRGRGQIPNGTDVILSSGAVAVVMEEPESPTDPGHIPKTDEKTTAAAESVKSREQSNNALKKLDSKKTLRSADASSSKINERGRSNKSLIKKKEEDKTKATKDSSKRNIGVNKAKEGSDSNLNEASLADGNKIASEQDGPFSKDGKKPEMMNGHSSREKIKPAVDATPRRGFFSVFAGDKKSGKKPPARKPSGTKVEGLQDANSTIKVEGKSDACNDKSQTDTCGDTTMAGSNVVDETKDLSHDVTSEEIVAIDLPEEQKGILSSALALKICCSPVDLGSTPEGDSNKADKQDPHSVTQSVQSQDDTKNAEDTKGRSIETNSGEGKDKTALEKKGKENYLSDPIIDTPLSNNKQKALVETKTKSTGKSQNTRKKKRTSRKRFFNIFSGERKEGKKKTGKTAKSKAGDALDASANLNKDGEKEDAEDATARSQSPESNEGTNNDSSNGGQNADSNTDRNLFIEEQCSISNYMFAPIFGFFSWAFGHAEASEETLQNSQPAITEGTVVDTETCRGSVGFEIKPAPDGKGAENQKKNGSESARKDKERSKSAQASNNEQGSPRDAGSSPRTQFASNKDATTSAATRGYSVQGKGEKSLARNRSFMNKVGGIFTGVAANTKPSDAPTNEPKKGGNITKKGSKETNTSPNSSTQSTPKKESSKEESQDKEKDGKEGGMSLSKTKSFKKQRSTKSQSGSSPASWNERLKKDKSLQNSESHKSNIDTLTNETKKGGNTSQYSSAQSIPKKESSKEESQDKEKDGKEGGTSLSKTKSFKKQRSTKSELGTSPTTWNQVQENIKSLQKNESHKSNVSGPQRNVHSADAMKGKIGKKNPSRDEFSMSTTRVRNTKRDSIYSGEGSIFYVEDISSWANNIPNEIVAHPRKRTLNKKNSRNKLEKESSKKKAMKKKASSRKIPTEKQSSKKEKSERRPSSTSKKPKSRKSILKTAIADAEAHSRIQVYGSSKDLTKSLSQDESNKDAEVHSRIQVYDSTKDLNKSLSRDDSTKNIKKSDSRGSPMRDLHRSTSRGSLTREVRKSRSTDIEPRTPLWGARKVNNVHESDNEYDESLADSHAQSSRWINVVDDLFPSFQLFGSKRGDEESEPPDSEAAHYEGSYQPHTRSSSSRFLLQRYEEDREPQELEPWREPYYSGETLQLSPSRTPVRVEHSEAQDDFEVWSDPYYQETRHRSSSGRGLRSRSRSPRRSSSGRHLSQRRSRSVWDSDDSDTDASSTLGL